MDQGREIICTENEPTYSKPIKKPNNKEFYLMKKYAGIIVVVIVVATGGYMVYDWWKQPLVSAANREKAQQYYEEYKKLTDNPDYLRGYAPEKVTEKLERALEKDPTRNDIRMELFSIYEEKTGHFAGQQEKMRKLLKEGLQVGMAPEKRQELAKVAASYYPGLLNAKSPAEARAKAVEIAPYTDWAIKWRVRFAAIKAKKGKENALGALKEVEEAIRKNARQDGTLNESQLRYVQYLKGRYYKATGDYEKAAGVYSPLMERLFSLPTWEERLAGIPAANLSYGDLMKETLQVLEQAEKWRELKNLIELSYKLRTDDSTIPDQSKWAKRDRELWAKADKNIEMGGRND